MAVADHIDLRDLPASAQQEVYDFYLFVRQRVLAEQAVAAAGEGALLSEQALADDWDRPEEDEAWQAFQ
jgi:hypothetical protein